MHCFIYFILRVPFVLFLSTKCDLFFLLSSHLIIASEKQHNINTKTHLSDSLGTGFSSAELTGDEMQAK